MNRAYTIIKKIKHFANSTFFRTFAPYMEKSANDSNTSKKRLLGLTTAELKQVAQQLGMPAFTGGQIAKWLYEKGVMSIDEMTNLSKQNRERLSNEYCVGAMPPIDCQRSVDGTVKYLFPVRCSEFADSAENGDNKADVEKSYCLIDNNITIARWLDTLVSGITGKQTFVLLNGIDDNEFIRGEKKTNDRKTVIMLGNMASYKGTKNGIQVLKQMQKEHNIRVIIYAASPSAEIPESFEFYCQPKRSELMKLYEEADICLFPSIREGWGLTVTEAMAHKCAVVGNPTGALNEIGVDGVNAIFSDGPSVNALYNALEKLLNDEGLMKKIQDSGYRTVSDLKISKQVEKLEKYLKHIVG